MPIDVKRKFFASISDIVAADFHPTEPWLLIGHWFSDVNVYNLDSGAVINTFSLSSDSATCVKFIARKNWYVVGSDDGKLHIFNYTTHKQVVVVNAHIYPIGCLAVHPTSPIILTGSWDNTVKAWDWDKQWKNIQTYEGHSHRIRSIAFNPKHPKTFASGCLDGTVKMWSIVSSSPKFTIKAHNKDVNWIDFYPGAGIPYLVTASDDKSIKIWDYHSQACIRIMTGHTNIVSFAAFHPSLPVIISGSWDGTINIWNSRSYEIERTLRYELDQAKCIALRKDTGEIAVGFNRFIVTIEVTHSEPFQKAILKHLPQSLNPAIARDTALCHSQPTSSQSHRAHRELNPHQQCYTLVLDLMKTRATNKLIAELKGDEAQAMADFLSKIADDNGTLTQRNRKRILYLLSKLAKSAGVFPQCLELEGVQFNLANPFTWGGYGVIFKGEHEGSSVCVKAVQVDLQGNNKRKLRAHASELTIWAHLSHRNVLPFLGLSPTAEEVPRVCIVSPWMDNGDLLQYLEKVSDAPRKPLVRDVISGLQYLHDLDVIHADLKAKNVLVSASGRAMLADFGISRLSVTLTITTTIASTGTAYWMAPELHLDDEPSPSRESDIWAFACTCYEIIIGMTPFYQYRNPVMLMGAFMRGKIIPSKPTPGIGWDEDVWLVAMRCWQRDPANRPKAHELLDIINGFDFPDDRPSDSEAKKSSSATKIDYGHILSILDQMRQSM